MVNAREIAYKVIYDVKYKKKYSNVLLNDFFSKMKIDSETKGFITYIVYGVLGRIYYLDYFIKQYSNIGFSKIGKPARVILEIAFFESIFMSASVSYASVNEAVNLAKKYDNRAKKFVNAVLRKFTSQAKNIELAKEHTFLDIKDIKQRLCVRYSVSEYIVGRFLDNYGKDFTEQLLKSMQEAPPLYVRANPLYTTLSNIEEKLQEQGFTYKLVDEKNMIFSLKNFKSIAGNALYKKGLLSIQDYASMKSVLVLDPQKGEKVLDLCAAPGGKSIFAAQLMQNEGEVFSTDISSDRLSLLKEQTERLGISIITTFPLDARVYRPQYQEKFDRVLVDVPCTGLGILRRKPEIRYKAFEEIESLQQTQKEILENAAQYLKVGGYLVYSTCTLGKEENGQVVEGFLQEHANFTLLKQKEYFPPIDKTDGFFICKMRKVSEEK